MLEHKIVVIVLFNNKLPRYYLTANSCSAEHLTAGYHLRPLYCYHFTLLLASEWNC